jgi:hypothetical protein
VACHVLVLAIASESRHARDDEPGIVLQENFGWGKTKALEDPRAEWVDQDIGCCEQAEENIPGLCFAQIECN